MEIYSTFLLDSLNHILNVIDISG